MKKLEDKEISDLDRFYHNKYKELHQLLDKLKKEGHTTDQLAKELIIQESVHLHMLYKELTPYALQAIKELTDHMQKKENLATKPQTGG